MWCSLCNRHMCWKQVYVLLAKVLIFRDTLTEIQIITGFTAPSASSLHWTPQMKMSMSLLILLSNIYIFLIIFPQQVANNLRWILEDFFGFFFYKSLELQNSFLQLLCVKAFLYCYRACIPNVYCIVRDRLVIFWFLYCNFTFWILVMRIN